MFYLKLALANIKKSGQTYIPYSLISVFLVSIFYIILSISQNKEIDNMLGGQMLTLMLMWGATVTGIFILIFSFYINSFLMKKRKSELGLYNVLGLNKSHIIRIVFCEKLILTGLIIVIGLILGIIFEKVFFLVLLKLIKVQTTLSFSISLIILAIVAVFFIAVNIILFIFDTINILRSNTIELLNSKKVGEKEPKLKIIWTLIGFICIGLGYFNSVSLKDPMSSMPVFFISVILVMIGTYALFMVGSITILKILKNRKGIYYKTNNFIAISTLMYRMKKNAVGLANMCILSTAVIIAISTTLSLYIGSNEYFNRVYRTDIQVNLYDANPDAVKQANKALQDVKLKQDSLNELTYRQETVSIDGNSFAKINRGTQSGDATFIEIPVTTYNKMTNQNVSLKENEGLIYHKTGYTAKSLKLDGKLFNVTETKNVGDSFISLDSEVLPSYVLVVNDNYFVKDKFLYRISFDLVNKADEATVANSLTKKLSGLSKQDVICSVEQRSVAKSDFALLYGGFLFIGILIGVVFLAATILIIYYKQISESYEDKERFEIMKKVGIDDIEIKKTIKKQTSLLFLSPVILACIHIAFAYPVVSKLLYLLNLRNDALFVKITIGTALGFILIYTVVYKLTSGIYYKTLFKK